MLGWINIYEFVWLLNILFIYFEFDLFFCGGVIEKFYRGLCNSGWFLEIIFIVM